MNNVDPNNTFVYTGKEELELQRLLSRYNAYIARMFCRATQPGQTLLDFGAGIGTIAKLMRESARPDKVVCVELDEGNQKTLRQQGFEVLAMPELCPPGTVDTIYSSNVLEHVEDQVDTLRALRECLKPEGQAVFWVPAFECLWTPFDEQVGHFRRYRRESLVRVFEEAGFRVEKCVYQDSVGFFVALLFKIISGKDSKISAASFKIYDLVIFPFSRLADLACSPFFGKNLLIYARK